MEMKLHRIENFNRYYRCHRNGGWAMSDKKTEFVLADTALIKSTLVVFVRLFRMIITVRLMNSRTKMS